MTTKASVRPLLRASTCDVLQTNEGTLLMQHELREQSAIEGLRISLGHTPLGDESNHSGLNTLYV